MKTVVGRRYYPTYYGLLSTYRSYRSVYVGAEPRKGSADQIIGYCDDSVADGWVTGPRGNPLRNNRKLTLPGLVEVGASVAQVEAIRDTHREHWKQQEERHEQGTNRS